MSLRRRTTAAKAVIEMDKHLGIDTPEDIRRIAEAGWVKVVPRPEPPHKHNLPKMREALVEKRAWFGSQYRCECGTLFELVEETERVLTAHGIRFWWKEI